MHSQKPDAKSHAVHRVYFLASDPHIRCLATKGDNVTHNSVVFIFAFMPIVLLLFYGARFFLRGTAQANTCKMLLLIASIVFFSWVAQQYLPLLFALIVLNYLAALLIHRMQWRRTVLAAAIVIDVAALAFYKYFNFFGEYSICCTISDSSRSISFSRWEFRFSYFPS